MPKVELRHFEDWIREHLPTEYKGVDICSVFSGYYTSSYEVYAEGERGGEDVSVYSAKDEEDLAYWAFESVCKIYGSRAELEHRPKNKKWRYYRHHAENGKWYYIEHRNYDYNAIEDARLDNFEGFLRLIKPVLPHERWEQRVKEYTHLMNYWYDPPHWAYDREKLCFVEIVDSPDELSENLDGENAIIEVVD